jgi:hypothetical protein
LAASTIGHHFLIGFLKGRLRPGRLLVPAGSPGPDQELLPHLRIGERFDDRGV